MPNVNEAIAMGLLGRDPEIKNFPNDGRYHIQRGYI